MTRPSASNALLLPPQARRATSILVLLFALIVAGMRPADASRLWRPAPAVELEIVDRENGQVLPQFVQRGQAWLPGEPGHRYAVRLRNRTGARMLAVLSVDGVNAVDGQTAGVQQAGYVLGPWQTLEVAGWRKSLDAVAQFVFVDPGASYAARTGRPDNLGVIGVAVFREKQAYRAPGAGIAREERDAGAGKSGSPRTTSAPAASDALARSERGSPGAYTPQPQASLGTGHGAIEDSHAYYAAFHREAVPSQVTELRYDTLPALLARGIEVGPRYPHHPYAVDGPRAFPGSFVPDPP